MTKTTTDKILDLMARECERAYRRGFQQGQVIGPDLDRMAVAKWRYGRSLASAPTPENGKPVADITPRIRLEIEGKGVEREVDALLSIHTPSIPAMRKMAGRS